jgi:hypothetical protein
MESSTHQKVSYAGNGVNDQFPVDFTFYESEHLTVVHVSADGDETTLVEDTDYSVTGGGGGTGTVEFPVVGSSYSLLASTEQLVILRIVPLTQTTDLKNYKTPNMELLERQLDITVQGLQYLGEQLDRSVKTPLESDIDADDLVESLLEASASAATSLGLAEDARDAAVVAQGEAENAADLALEWAENDEDDPVETGKYSAKHWAAKAEESAQGSADNTSYDNATSGLTADDVQGAVDELAAALAAAISTTSVETIQALPGGMSPSAAGGAQPMTVVTTANGLTVAVVPMPGDADSASEFSLDLPANWNAGTLKYKIRWVPASGASAGDDVRFSLAACSASPGESIDQALGTAVTVDDDVESAGELHETAVSGALTVAGTPAAGDRVHFRLSRVTGQGASPMAEDAHVVSVLIQIGKSGAESAW